MHESAANIGHDGCVEGDNSAGGDNFAGAVSFAGAIIGRRDIAATAAAFRYG